MSGFALTPPAGGMTVGLTTQYWESAVEEFPLTAFWQHSLLCSMKIVNYQAFDG